MGIVLSSAGIVCEETLMQQPPIRREPVMPIRCTSLSMVDMVDCGEECW